ncbi:hypothetical protein SprV_0100488400 [Sparganum proliferum]
MGEIGTNLLLQRIAEQAREQRMISDAALENKFRKLPNPTSPRNDKLVHNLSSKELTKDQVQVLRHEASFNTTGAKPVNMIAAVESILCQTEATEGTKNLIRHQASSLLMAHRPREVLSKVERDALRELKADKDLVIVPADKGRSTVVLDRTDYLQKAKGLLEDRQFYVPCATNPLKTLTREINATLLALENSGAITPTDRRMARPQDTALAPFYGLPKVHKDGAPLRPIVSLEGTPTYGLAKWLLRRLKSLTAESDTTVSSSAQFLEKLKGDLAIETIELLLQSKYDETNNRLGRAQVLQLLKFCLRTYFTFDGTIYEQVKGTPMGSPISGFIAEAVLQRLESLVFQCHKPKFWTRYVDDTFVVIERDQVLTFQEHLNAVFPDIQFTMEEEENNQLAFLDVLVCRKDCGGLKTKCSGKRQLKTALRAVGDPGNWSDNLPLAFLGIRAALKSDLGCSAAELVFGTTFRLLGEMITPTSRGADETPDNLVHRLRADLLVTSAPKLGPRSYKAKRPNAFHRPDNSDLTFSELAIMLLGPPLYELQPSIPAEPTACPCLPYAFLSASPTMLNPLFPSLSSSTSCLFPSTSSTTTPSPSSPPFTHSSSDLSASSYIEPKPTNQMMTEADLRGFSFTDVMPLSDLLTSQPSLSPKPNSRPPAIRLPSPPISRHHFPAINSHVSCSMLDPISNPIHNRDLLRLCPLPS